MRTALNAIRNRTNGSMVNIGELQESLQATVPPAAVMAVLESMQRDNLLMICDGDVILI